MSHTTACLRPTCVLKNSCGSRKVAYSIASSLSLMARSCKRTCVIDKQTLSLSAAATCPRTGRLHEMWSFEGHLSAVTDLEPIRALCCCFWAMPNLIGKRRPFLPNEMKPPAAPTRQIATCNRTLKADTHFDSNCRFASRPGRPHLGAYLIVNRPDMAACCTVVVVLPPISCPRLTATLQAASRAQCSMPVSRPV